MTSIIVTAQRWESKLGGGWELLNGDHAMTQVRRLSDARQQVIDYLDTIDPDVDHRDWDIRLFALWGVGVVFEASRGSWAVSWDDDRTQEFTWGASSTKSRT